MKKKLRSIVMKKKPLLAISAILVLAILLSTFFPIYILDNADISTEEGASFFIGQGGNHFPYRITIGSPVMGADTADYTCDGTDDNETFQTALNALPSGGGQLFILAGTYSWATGDYTVTRAIDNVSIIGVGGSVYFDTDDTHEAFQAGGNNWLFAHLQVDNGGIDMGATTDWMWLNCEVAGTYYALYTDSINVENHSSLHESGGADEIKLDDLGTPDNNTDLDATTGHHGLLPMLGGGTTNFLRADGTWAAPAGSGDVSGPGSSVDEAIARFHETTGKVIQAYTSNSPTISDVGVLTMNANIVMSGSTTVDGRDVGTDGSKLDGIEIGATKYPDTGEQAFLDADHTKLDGIETGATKYPDTGEQAFLDADHDKLDGIEALADVTDAANVALAGALMTDGSEEMSADIVWAEAADHSSTPAAGKGYLWVKNTAPSTLIFTDDDGTDTTLGAGGGDVATDSIWNAKGDIAVATGDDTATVLAVGTDNYVLRVSTDTPVWEALGTMADETATDYILHSLSTAANDFLVGSGANTYVKKTLAETGAILETDIDHDLLQGFVSGEHFLQSAITQTGTITSGTWASSTPVGVSYGGTGATDASTARTNLGFPAAGVDSTAIHDNVAGEIAAISEKASPVSGDKLLIEDSENSNIKKYVQVGNLPASVHALGAGQSDVTITDVADDEVLAYNSGTTHWINQTPSEAGLLAIALAAAKGDMLLATGNDAWTILTVGSENQVLTVGASNQVQWSTPAGGGDVVKVGTPVNEQLGIWTGDGTIKGDVGLTYASYTLAVGIEDTDEGILVLNGDTDAGGLIQLHVEDDSDTIITSFDIAPHDDDFWIGPSTDTDMLMFNDSTSIQATKPFILSGDTSLYSGADLIVYSDAGVSEVARIDGATGAITTSSTVDNVDVAALDSAAVKDSDFTQSGGILVGTGAGTYSEVLTIAGVDSDAIHDNVAGEIAAITVKSTPVSGDLLLIEDSAASNAKKYITVGSLPASTHALGAGQTDVTITDVADNEVLAYNDGTSQWINQTPAEAGLQSWDDDLDDLAGLTPTDSYFIVGDNTDWTTESGDTVRTSLGLAIGTDIISKSTFDTHEAASTGVHGAGANTLLHTGNLGSSVQDWDDDLDDLAALTPTDSYIIVGDNSDWVTETGATARTSLGLGTGDTPQFTGVTIANGGYLGSVGDTDAISIATGGSVSITAGDLIFTEKADHSSTPGEGFGYLWVKTGAPSTMWFTDDGGTDHQLGVGGGDVSKTGSPANTYLATWTDGSTITGVADLQFSGQTLEIGIADTDEGILILNADADAGGLLQLHVEGDSDDPITSFDLSPHDDDFWVGPSTDTDMLKFNDSTSIEATKPFIGTTIDALTDFTIDGLVLTADSIANDAALAITTSTGDISLMPAATYDVNIPVNIGLAFGDGGENIETDNTDFTITSGGKINLSASGAIDVNAQDIINGGVIFLNEQADAEGDTAGDGQIWVNTADPNELYFTTDTGIDKRLDSEVTITFVIDGGGSAITTGVWGFLEIPFNCYITGWTLVADQSGSIVIDVWNDTYANFPPTVADTIAGSEKPTLSSADDNQDLTLTTWTEEITAGNVMGFNVDSASTVERVTLSIRAYKT